MNTNTTRTKAIARIDGPSVLRVFQFEDRFGRQLGAAAHVGQDTFVELSPEELAKYCSWSTIAPGVWFYFLPQATRAGQAYGASQRTQWFATEVERDAAVRKYLDQAERRASKVRGAVAVRS